MIAGRHKLDLSVLRRRHNPSATSSMSLSPTVPTLESPVTFQALTVRAVSEATMAQRDKLDKPPVRPSMFIEERDDGETIAPSLTCSTPADTTSVDAVRKSVEEEPICRTKSQYFEDIFNARGRGLSPKAQDFSVVVAELKLNKKVIDDESLASMISSRLAHIYQKPESSMMVTIQQEACLRFGVSQCPAYLMKVYALPYSIAPITNLRCTILIQSALRELLQIEPSRGVVLYLPVPEENLATNNVTYTGELPRHTRRTEDEDPGILRNISRSLSRRLKSNSTHSAPLSEATTSSWNPEVEVQQLTSAKGKNSLSSDVSREGEESSQGNDRGSKILRHFLSRRKHDPHGAIRD